MRGILLAIVLGVLAFGAVRACRQQPAPMFTTGDCATWDLGGSSIEKVDCSSSNSKGVVVAVSDLGNVAHSEIGLYAAFRCPSTATMYTAHHDNDDAQLICVKGNEK